MVAKLKSVSTNQTLRLASKAVAASLILYWVRNEEFGFFPSLVFICISLLFYFRPALNNGRFAPSALLLILMPFFTPRFLGLAEIVFIGTWGMSLFLLLGVKSLLFVKRRKIYRVVHFAIISSLAALLIERFGIMTQALIFIALVLVIREFYFTITDVEGEHVTLIAALEALIFIELSWALSFISVDSLVGGAFLTLFVLVFHDTTAHKLSGSLSRPILIRNGSMFALITIVISALSSFR